jgi:hypothetical protein
MKGVDTARPAFLAKTNSNKDVLSVFRVNAFRDLKRRRKNPC